VVEAGVVDEISLSFAFYGGEFYHHKPVVRHVIEGVSGPFDVEY
jgi:hypothetical protein